MPMSIAQYLPSIIASANVIPNVSDYLEVNTSLVKPFSFVLERVLSSGGRQAVE